MGMILLDELHWWMVLCSVSWVNLQASGECGAVHDTVWILLRLYSVCGTEYSICKFIFISLTESRELFRHQKFGMGYYILLNTGLGSKHLDLPLIALASPPLQSSRLKLSVAISHAWSLGCRESIRISSCC